LNAEEIIAMARHIQAKRSRRKLKRRSQRQKHVVRRDSDGDYTVAEWCRKRRVSRGTFYKLMKAGLAPTTMKIRKCRRISAAADAAWQAQRETEAADA
jgi:hypothetical protein